MEQLSKFKKSEDGQVAVFFALLAVPLLLVTTLTLDFMQASSERRGLQDALDNAALAAANRNDIDAAGKQSYALTHFEENYLDANNARVVATASDAQVKISATTTSNVTLGGIVGKSDLELSGEAVAAIANKNTICVLALAEDEPNAIRFQGDLSFQANNCAVHANSRDSEALVNLSTKRPVAKNFCATGGVRGSFSPLGKGECLPISDPYANVLPPSESKCVSQAIFEKEPVNAVKSGEGNLMSNFSDRKEYKDFKTVLDKFQDGYDTESPAYQTAALQLAQEYEQVRGPIEPGGLEELDKIGIDQTLINGPNANGLINGLRKGLYIVGDVPDVGQNGVGESTNYTGHNLILSPGTYCGGLTVDGINVTFLPGDYIMKDGPLTLRNEGQAKGDDVTISFTGVDAVLQIESGGKMAIKAPEFGPRKGLAFMQIAQKVNTEQLPNGYNLINDRGGLVLTGTMYFPQQVIRVSGSGTNVGATSPATSFIGYTVDISGDISSKMSINIDHQKAGIPAIKPSAEDGARLVR